jgi:uncharacterized protein (DUF1501 family)
MQRRQFIAQGTGALGLLAAQAPGWAQGVASRSASVADRVLILIELKGGNDGLNTLVPYADPLYYQLRNTIAIGRDEVLRLDERTGLHPELKALLPLWERGELALVQGVGYPQPNLSHFRSIEIWDTASRAGEYLDQGWVTRAMNAGYGATAAFTAQGVLIGANEFGPLAGARAVMVNNPESFVNQARFAAPVAARGNAALQHVLRVESDVSQAAEGLRGDRFAFRTEFPQGTFGNAVRAAVQVVATQRDRPGKGAGVPVIVLTLGSFDTHQNQAGPHAALLRQLAQGMASLRAALQELGAWDRSLIMSFSEFGRRARQNQSNGTDHGTAAPHFVAGGAVRGGLYGQPPDLARLDAAQNLVHSVDFRQLYSTVARDWWGVDAETVVRGRFDTLPLLRA